MDVPSRWGHPLWRVAPPLSGPPGKTRQPKVDKAGDLLCYAVVRDRWERRSCGEGAKGQRFYDWTAFEVTVTGQQPAPGFAHWLLVRRSTEKKQLAGGRVDYETPSSWSHFHV